MNDKPHLPPYEVKEVPLSRVLAELSNWAFRSFRIKELWEHTKGEKVKVCVLDTGCNHKDIQVFRKKDFTKTGLTDENGHGTWVSGCIRAAGGFLGIAPECELYVGKILRKDGSGEWVWLEAGLEWALAQGCQVINVSAGGEYTGPTFPVLEKLDKAGILTICAAGNSGTYLIYPAVSVHTIAVGAVDKAWERAAFSNVGLGLITMAPGVELLGCWRGDGYAKATGTSMATPIISGIVTLERALREMNVREAITRFIATSKDIEIPGYDPLSGWGIIEPHKFLKIEEAEKRKWTWAWFSAFLMFMFWYLLFRPKKKK